MTLVWWTFMQQSHPMPRLSLCIGMMVLSQPQGTVQTVNCYLFFLHFRKNPKKDRIDFLRGILIRSKSSACDFFSCCPVCLHARMPASTTEPQDTLAHWEELLQSVSDFILSKHCGCTPRGVMGVKWPEILWEIQKYSLPGRPSSQNWVKSKTIRKFIKIP